MINPEHILLAVILVTGFYTAWSIGANDVANAMGTSVGSGALTLRKAVYLAAILEFSGAYFFGSHVSVTIQSGIIDTDMFASTPQYIVYGMLSSLMAAGVWLQFASYLGLPVSTTHTIVGAIAGFGAVIGGLDAIKWENMSFIISSWILSPLAGGALSFYTFSILRKQIFYSFNPIEQAKKITPIAVFLVFMILSLIFFFEGLKNIDIKFSFIQAIGLCLITASAASAISYLLVRRINSPSSTEQQRPPYGSEVTQALEKAKKHLGRVQSVAIGELNFQVSNLIEEISDISSSLEKKIEKEVSHSEYAVVERIFGYLQILSACMMSFAHGANDVANAIGPLAAAVNILTTGTVSATSFVPTWALALGGVGIIVGLATWGWRVIETIGKKITELTPTRGFAAEFGAAATILVATRLGLPISTTHTLVGSVIGVGLARGIEALNLSMTRDIVISWIVTVPAGALLSVGFFYSIKWVFG